MQQFGDQERMDDALTSQKAITEGYNAFANECAAPALKSEFMNLLSEEHQIQHELFTEMMKRGWYQTTPADPEQVRKARRRFAGQG